MHLPVWTRFRGLRKKGAMPAGEPPAPGRGPSPRVEQPTSRGRGDIEPPSAARLLLPRRSLQILWAGATFARSMGEPPLDTGTISSTSKLIGSPAGRS